jgi:hypothetical protein
VQADPQTAILGTWRLVHSVEFGSGGEKHYPFGKDAVGYIIYTPSGVMAVQITRREGATARTKAAVSKEDYLAYFGRYELDVQNGVVRHLLEGALFPKDYPGHVERRYRFFDGMLSLKPLDGTNREILWQRV